MGQVLDTPSRCPLCGEVTRDLVTLKCSHQFCQRCLGDLWSVSPTGPYHCPQWRCSAVYRTPPFARSQTGNNAGIFSNEEQNTSDPLLTRPTLARRLLGKRKASAPVSEQPATKRTTVQSPSESSSNAEIPSTSSSDKAGVSAVVGASKKPEVTLSERSDSAHQNDNSDRNKIVHISDDSDSASEIDLCESPLIVTPKKDAHKTGSHSTPKKPANSLSSHGDSRTSPVHQVSKTPPLFTKRPASVTGSPSHAGASFRPENRGSSPVRCHYCPKTGYQSAVKTCLVCGASMCKEHLRPHLESPVFQTHTLVAPMEDISLWRCQEHQEMNRIYCRQCGVCVCTVCTVIGSHRDHACISIREAERDLRANLKDEIKQLQEAEQQVNNRVNELTQKKEASQVVLNEAQACVKKQYEAIREALEQEEQSALQCVLKEETQVLGGLEEKLSRLRSSLQSIQNGLHTLESLSDAKGEKQVQEQAFIMEYSKVSHLTSDVGSDEELFEATQEVDQARLKCLQRWTENRLDAVVITMPGKDRDLYKLLYGTIPLLDTDTAHPKLQLSDSNRRASYSEAQQDYTEHEARFSSFPQVLASCALEGGRWYWEVEVSADEGRWKVGLCESQMERKGQKDSARLGFNGSSWCLAYDRKKLEALHNKESFPVKADGLQRVGVFLDFQEGSLSFFNATPGGSLALLHSYKHTFSSPVYPAFSVSKTHLAICELFQS
ncbi:E3 ubiquitin/ISG15 ligase TRIM25 [Cololabis saira]|uniref:E3 ubiquitin/ISG15 ligase TRIM25 n=1 Tax=Cololabis saira TaxID=129043 RepID=UPI002AD3553B|nr:E3 ubiquitin/ISG15 ligase TRIM25 [Cololabis saira]